MSDNPGPLSRLVAVAWTVLLISIVLWVAAWLLSQIYVWLIVIAVVAVAIWLLAWWRRRRW
jgi:Flp pilus assembly protein TadB